MLASIAVEIESEGIAQRHLSTIWRLHYRFQTCMPVYISVMANKILLLVVALLFLNTE